MARRLALAAGLLVFVLAGCAPFPLSQHSGGTRTLNWFMNVGSNDWETTLDPATVADPMAIADIQMMHAGLVRVSYPDLTVVPDLARWTVTPDHRVWTFHIRPRARFSNGDPVTASDAAWSLTRALLPSTKSSVALTYLGHVMGALDVASGKTTTLRGARVLDKKTLRLTLDAPVAYFLPALSYPTATVLDRRVLQGKTSDTYVTSTCRGNVGAGPFRLVCRNGSSTRGSFYPPGQSPRLDYEPNPFYYGHRPRIDVHAPFVDSNETAWTQYRKGELDGVVVPPSHIEEARGLPGFRQAPLLQTDFLSPNLYAPPFSDTNCRLAVAYGIDRARITRTVLQGMARPLYGVVPSGLPGYVGAQAGVPTYDPVSARKFLQACPGKLDGIALTFDQTSPEVVREYHAIQAALRRIGANVRLRPIPFHSWLNLVGHPLSAAKPPVVLTQSLWPADYPDPQDWCETLLRSGANFDISGYSDPHYDRLVDAAALEWRSRRRARLYIEAQRIALNAGAAIPVGQAVGSYVVSTKVHGLIISSGGPSPIDGDWSKVTIAG